jgi:outer membrane protein assembly factor BamD (BamD/ComL family)
MENASPPIEEPARAVDAPRTLAPHRAVVPSEPELLKRAWTALSDGEPQKALQITEQDAQLHPDGDLAEEREAARIAALAKLHRIDEARSAASRFLQVHPASVHRALVERAIHSEEMP